MMKNFQLLQERRISSGLEKGKNATVFVSDGDPLLFDTNILSAYIDGRKVDMNDRHKMLRDKYLEKYKQLNIIK